VPPSGSSRHRQGREEVEILGIRDAAGRRDRRRDFRKLWTGRGGDNIGLCSEHRARGHRAAARSSPSQVGQADTKFQASLRPGQGGGRRTPVLHRYRPQFYIRTTDVTGRPSCSRASRWSCPAQHQPHGHPDHPIALEEGLRFPSASGKTVGAASSRNPRIRAGRHAEDNRPIITLACSTCRSVRTRPPRAGGTIRTGSSSQFCPRCRKHHPTGKRGSHTAVASIGRQRSKP